jgi:GWxTD domain-containing protein
MTVPAALNSNFVIRCTVTDSTKGTKDNFMIPVDRLSKPSRNDFLITDMRGVPIMRYYLSALDTVRVNFRYGNVPQFACKYYNRNFPLAAPPFTFDMHEDFNYAPDSFFFLSKEQLEKISFSSQGFYHIQTDTSGKDGLTLFRFSPGFPDVTNTNLMIEGVRYLTSKKEYDDIKAAANPKSMLDNFWLTHGGNEEKSRLLIKKYYGRIRDANKYFSSHTEGWRTDRGMIYVIFGSPGTIYKSDESESWIYGTPNSSLALNFFFIKVNNPFTINDYTLSRSPSYEGAWYRAVEVWRQGRAYNSMY